MAFDDQRQAIIDGLDSAQSEAAGWDALRSSIPVTAVVRTSNSVVTITLPALGSYNITAPETITATVPAAALSSGVPRVATPTISIRSIVAVSGAHIASTTQLFSGTVGQFAGFDAVRQAIINGLVSAQSEPLGWNALRGNIPVSAVVRTSNTVVTITLPALLSYDINNTEFITATVPGAALAGGSPVVASPLLFISPVTTTEQQRWGLSLLGVG